MRAVVDVEAVGDVVREGARVGDAVAEVVDHLAEAQGVVGEAERSRRLRIRGDA